MNLRIRSLTLAASALAAVFAVSTPVLADGGHGHGGGVSSGAHGGGFSGNRGGASGASRGGGNFRSSPGASHSGGAGRNGGFGGGGGGGGGHSFGGGGGGGHSFGGGGGHSVGGGNVGGGHSYGGGRAYGYGGAQHPAVGNGGHYSPGVSGHVYGGSPGYGRGGVGGRPGFGSHPGPSHGFGGRPGFHGGFHGGNWHGGNFHGRFWPGIYYRPGYSRFLPFLPGIYSTFYFGGISYYYANDLYYTWSPDAYGYVVTDPPPVADSASSDSGSAEVESANTSNVYVYPRNGQSEEQTSTDRYECHQWAVGQTGFDPTNGSSQSTSASPDDYKRALMACLDARGYSAN